VRSSNKINAAISYTTGTQTPLPPWNYSQAIDNVAKLPLYGNFVWLYSTDANSLGYFVFFCHLQNETTIKTLKPEQQVGVNTPVGVMGDTGNAQGAPQLHTEIHYLSGSSFTCTRCGPNKVLTSIDAEASLTGAAKRSTA
jgi:murein DD-endopeptidase MepM/ murein hydrolase activator NlpD